jgi:hypothetical protein
MTTGMLAHNPILVEMARIVQAADFKDQLDAHPAARGLALISYGFPLVTADDHETVQRASFLYDALYESLAKTLEPAREQASDKKEAKA